MQAGPSHVQRSCCRHLSCLPLESSSPLERLWLPAGHPLPDMVGDPPQGCGRAVWAPHLHPGAYSLLLQAQVSPAAACICAVKGRMHLQYDRVLRAPGTGPCSFSPHLFLGTSLLPRDLTHFSYNSKEISWQLDVSGDWRDACTCSRSVAGSSDQAILVQLISVHHTAARTSSRQVWRLSPRSFCMSWAAAAAVRLWWQRVKPGPSLSTSAPATQPAAIKAETAVMASPAAGHLVLPLLTMPAHAAQAQTGLLLKADADHQQPQRLVPWG